MPKSTRNSLWVIIFNNPECGYLPPHVLANVEEYVYCVTCRGAVDNGDQVAVPGHGIGFHYQNSINDRKKPSVEGNEVIIEGEVAWVVC